MSATDSIRATGAVAVSRDGDFRMVLVPVSELRNPHIATVTGGREIPLPQPMLAGYIFCDVLPEGAAFGHGHVHCRRRGRPSSIRVVVEREATDATLYDQLRRAAERTTHEYERACADRKGA